MSSQIAMCHGSAICAEPIEVSVKNTFVHFVEGTGSEAKRPSSLPPSIRFSSITRDAKLGSDLFPETDMSTEASEDEAFSEVGSNSIGDIASVLENELASERSKESSLCVSELHGTRLCSSAKVWKPAVPEHPLGISLRTSAMAWTPMVPAPSRPESSRVSRDFEQVVAMVKSILMSCLWIEAVDFVESDADFSIVVIVPAQRFNHREEVITLAKEALLQAADHSSGIYVMGYKAKPFVTMPMGFAALLAGVPDEHRACWNVLQTGFCHYGDRCHWEHPSFKRKINVKIKLPDVP